MALKCRTALWFVTERLNWSGIWENSKHLPCFITSTTSDAFSLMLYSLESDDIVPMALTTQDESRIVDLQEESAGSPPLDQNLANIDLGCLSDHRSADPSARETLRRSRIVKISPLSYSKARSSGREASQQITALSRSGPGNTKPSARQSSRVAGESRFFLELFVAFFRSSG